MPCPRDIAFVALLGIGAAQGPAPAGDWPRFRGPNGSGVAEDGDIPMPFGPDTNVAWKTATPPGHSSPCIVGDALYLTAYADDQLETIAFDRASGAVRWRRRVPPGTIERGSQLGSPATSTPAGDADGLVVYFGSFGLVAYDHQGSERWRHELPTPVTQHGASSSPIIAAGRVILPCDQDVGSYVLAIDRATGETVWRTSRPGFRRGFSTPLAWPPENPREVVVAGTLRIVAYGLERGEETWHAAGLPNEMVSSPVAADGLVFACGWTHGSGVSELPKFDALLEEGDGDGDSRLTRDEAPAGPAKQHFVYIDADKDGRLTRDEWDSMAEIFTASENALIAVRPPTDAPRTEAEIAWKQDRGLPYVPSPLVHRGAVFIVKNGGIASSFDATTGEPRYHQQRVGAFGNFYASPVAAGGRILVASQEGTMIVLGAGAELEILAKVDLGESILATPAIVGDRLYVRSAEHLWCFAAAGDGAESRPARIESDG